MTALTILESIPQSLKPLAMPTIPNGKQLPAIPEHFLNLDTLTADVIAPKNFFSVEELKEELEDNRATSLVLTSDRLSMELVFDPTSAPTPEDWALCLSFKERGEKLVINARIRTKAISHICGSRLVNDWIAYIDKHQPRVALFIGDVGGKAALTFERASGGKVVDMPANGKSKRKGKSALEDTNKELFG